jgi:regulator of RNase E activity RraA
VTELVERLRRLDSSAVSDSLDALGRPGVVSGIQPLWSSGRIAGRVMPVRLVPVGEADPPPHHLGAAAIEAGGPDHVIVVDNSGRTEMGGWGGLLGRGAQARGIAGVVVDGACRDVEELAEIGFPVFARAATARTARGRVVECVGDKISVGGVAVRSGDLVLADRGAVVFLRAEDAEQTIEAAEAIVARETVMAAALAQGLPATSVLGADYEELIARIAEGQAGSRR